MEVFDKDIPPFAMALLSGFIASWIFYGLTSHPKPSAFERVVQALIFTAIVKVPVEFTKWILVSQTAYYGLVFGEWSPTAVSMWSIGFAVLIGFLVAWAVNKDFPHRHLRDWKFTKRHTFPSVWSHYFNDDTWHPWAVLHLKPTKEPPRPPRRLYGWVKEWPDQPDSGHFVIMLPQWLYEDNKVEDLDMVDRILISTADVEMVEFMKEPKETSQNGQPADDKK